MESSQEFDTTAEKIEAMALASEREQHDRSGDPMVTDVIEAAGDKTVIETKELDVRRCGDLKKGSTSEQARNISQSKNSQKSSDSCDDMLSFVNTPPSRGNLGKKLPPKGVKRVKVNKLQEDDMLTSPVNSQDNSRKVEVLIGKDSKSSNHNESTDDEVTFKTPVIKDPVKKVQKDAESPTDLFSQISPASLQAACRAVDFAIIEENSLCANKTTEEIIDKKDITSSLGFEIQDKCNSDLNETSPIVLKEVATSTPVVQSCDKDFDVDITPIGKNCNNTPIRWRKDISSMDTDTTVSKMKIGSGFALRRRAKRFSYPSSSQIRDTCPEKVFNFQPTSDRQLAEISNNTKDLCLENENSNVNMNNNSEPSNVKQTVHTNEKFPSSKNSETTRIKPYWKRCSAGKRSSLRVFLF